MDRNGKEHLHIRWSSGRLDWERFSTTAEAQESARQLARAGETFTIEEYDDCTCPTCSKLDQSPENWKKSRL